ncbi:hypothetical protein BKE38_11840 [Pseudoroseomonas deserti]|uniref:DUF1849 domain-containing protein n=1 Tax=Teichococcus deserti TaxID=1817963 RepID=A0A1V2H4R0_9PROT|nr:DUF1849 family protein [Pseudoroseomonas deserti]ONG53513.1 hypothetical protein BKE38_11840 [Pseudoroseomonas deserti]
MRLRDTLAGFHALPAAALLALGLAAAGPASAQQPAAPAAPAAPAPAAGAPHAVLPGTEAMAPHRAAYRLRLDRVRQGSDVVQAGGAMLFEVLDACDGWATRQRLQLTVVNRSGDQVETSSDYSTWESKDGRRLRFSLTQTAQGAVTQRISGEAELAGAEPGAEGGTVRYEQPSAQQVTLPRGTLLPMMHTIRALALAKAGQQRMLNAPLFDGTSEDGAQDSTTLLSPWTEAQAQPRFPLLSQQASARMRIAFFGKESAAAAGASAPEYEVGLRYFANGVADEMKMDFGDFAVDGLMQSLEAVPAAC